MLKVFGSRGVNLAAFLAGLVNSTVAVSELASRTRSAPELTPSALRGTVLACAAMLVRNGILLVILAPDCLISAAIPLLGMLGVCGLLVVAPWNNENGAPGVPAIELDSPFSLPQVLKFGVLFLLLTVAGTLAERWLGGSGLIAVGAAGGPVSSASVVASSGQLAAHAKAPYDVAGTAAVVASIASALVSIPIVASIAKDSKLTRGVAFGIGGVALAGIALACSGPVSTPFVARLIGR